MRAQTFNILLLACAAAGARAAVHDPTSATLAHCHDNPTNSSTAGQTDCESAAIHNYDRRMDAAYATLIRKLPAVAVQQLKLSQRSWLAFRDRESAARSALYATRQGTMYVPMEASDAANVIRDRALQLEAYVRVLSIE
jgi:uncharacterized protein YecT (DUF1311 family)